MVALLLELVPLEEDLPIQLLVSDHLLLLHERKEGCHIHGRRSSRQMISSACLALPPRTTCWRSSGCHLAVPENSPLGDGDDAVIVRLPAAAAPPPLHHDHDHHIIITLARSLASPTLPSLLLRPMIVELAFSHAALPLSLTLRSDEAALLPFALLLCIQP